MLTKIEIYLAKMYANTILENPIVSTILLVLSKELKLFKKQLDVTINNDI